MKAACLRTDSMYSLVVSACLCTDSMYSLVVSACLCTDSMYSLAVSANRGIGAGSGALGLESDAAGEGVGGDGTTRAGSMGRGGVSVVSIGTES